MNANNKNAFAVMPPLPAALVAVLNVQFGRPRKRERTRGQLINAAMAVFSARGVAQATILDIAAAAEMTPGTFYNHFKTKAEIVEAVATWIADAFCYRIVESFRDTPEGAERTSIGCRRFVWLAEQSPAWALLVLDVATNSQGLLKQIGHYIRADLRLGVKQKAYSITTETAALDMISGTVIQAMRSMAFGLASRRHGSDVAAMVLRGLGVPLAKAQEIARRPLPAFRE